MADFKLFFPKLMQEEGGYVDDPNDKGGATKWGITLQEWIDNGYDKNNDGVINKEDIKLLTKEDAFKIAKLLYWDKLKCDQINSQSIAEFLCDFAYNSGVVIATRKLQKILGVDADGIIGNITLAKLNSSNQESIFNAFKQSRIDFVITIVNNNPSQGKFLKGWLQRINSFNFTN